MGCRRSVLLAILVFVVGCQYSFSNPVQKLENGSIAGQVTLVNAVPGQTTQGGIVSVPWSGGLQVTLGSQGGFAFLQLPDGVYSLSTYIPPLASNDFPLLQVLRGIPLPLAQDSVDALNLGTISVQPSGLVSGTVTDGQGLGIVAVVAAYTPPDADSGVQLFEGFSTTSAADGGFALLLPAGNHVLAASDAISSVVANATVQASGNVNQNFSLDGGTSSNVGSVSGTLVFGGAGFGASAPADQINQILPGITFEAFDGGLPGGQLVVSGFVYPMANDEQGVGAAFILPLPAGQPLNVVFTFPGGVAIPDGGAYEPLLLPSLPVVAGVNTILGQVTWLPQSVFQANLPDAGGQTGTGTTGTGGGPSTGGSGGTSAGSSSGTSGSSTGGTSGSTTGSSGGMDQWTLVNSLVLPSADGGSPAISGVLPLPLADGGNRLVWATSTNVYYADDPGQFGPPIPLIDAGETFPLTNLSAAATNGGSVVAWVSGISDTVQGAFIPEQGGVPHPINFVTPVVAFPGLQGTSTFTGSLGGTPGIFVIAPQFTGGLAVMFTSDNQNFSYVDFPLNVGASEIFVNTIVGSACNINDFPTGVGFCFAGSGGLDSAANFDGGLVFVGSVDSSGANLMPENTQVLFNLPFSAAAAATVALAAIPNGGGMGDIVYVTAQQGMTTQWASFTGLSQAPVTQTLPGGPSLIDLILPWEGQPVGFSLQRPAAGVLPVFVPSGVPAASILPNVLAGYPASNFGTLNGYTDALTGLPTVAVAYEDGGVLFIWQLSGSGVDPIADGG